MESYHALMNKRSELEKRRSAIASNPADVSVEDIDNLAAEITENEAKIEALEKIRDLERKAPAEGSYRAPLTTEEPKDPKAGFKTLAEMALAVRGVCSRVSNDPRLDAISAGPSGIGAIPASYNRETQSTEGWEVPPDFRKEIWEVAVNGTDIFSRIAKEPTNSNSIEMGVDESTPWGSTGIQAYWRTEAQQMTASKLATKGARCELNELYAFVAATEELLSDAPRLNSRLTKGAGRAIEWVASESLMFGDGVGKPKGWMSSAALVSVAKESGQAAATLNVTNIAKMFARLYRGAGAMPIWFANSDILPQLIGLTIGNQPVWLPANAGMKDNPGGNLLGLPIDFSEHCPTLGTEGDLQCVDLSGYYAAMRTGGIQFAESIHLWFDYGLQAFRWTVRFGGQPILSAPISPAKGAATKSHFVSLATRA